MFSPSKRKEYTEQVQRNIEKMQNKPHRKLFVNEYAENNKFGEPLQRIDDQDLKWKQKRDQFQINQQSYINQFSPKKRSKSQLIYDPKTSDFISSTDRQSYLQKHTVHPHPKKKQFRDRLNESCSNIFATNNTPTKTTGINNNNNNYNNSSNKQNNILNASVTFWNKPKNSVSPYRNRTSSTILDSFQQDENISSTSQQNNKNNNHSQSVFINPNYINRYKNTNIILGFNDSSPQRIEKGIRTYHDQIPCDTNISHLVVKTSLTGFNHNISYQANDRSRENSQTNARIFNLGTEATPSFHNKINGGIKTFFNKSINENSNENGLPNPVTGQNLKKEKGIGLRMVNTSQKKSSNVFDSIYNSMSEFSPDKNTGIKCSFNNNQHNKSNPIVMFDVSDPQQQQQQLSARQGKKLFSSKQSPVKYLLQQNNNPQNQVIKPTNVVSENNNNNVNSNTSNANLANHASEDNNINNNNSIVMNNSMILQTNGNIQNQTNQQNLDQSLRQSKRLVDQYPKGNKPSQQNFLAYQNSSTYMDKFKDFNNKNPKGQFGQRNKSPNMMEVLNLDSSFTKNNNNILTNTNKHNISVNNNNNNNDGNNVEQINDKIGLNQSQYDNKSEYSQRQQQQSHQHQQPIQQSQQQSQQQFDQQSTHSQMQEKQSQYTPQSKNSNKSQQLNSGKQNNINLSQHKSGVKMGEISGVKKIYDFESFKNKYR